MSLVAMSTSEHLIQGTYQGVITEATGFASQRLVRKQAMSGEHWGFMIEKPYSEFVNETGQELFPTVQTPSIVQAYLKAAPSGSTSQLFQLAKLYAAVFTSELLKDSLSTQLQYLVTHELASSGHEHPLFANTPSRLNVVARQKWSAGQRVVHMTREQAEVAFVELIESTHPGWQEQLRTHQYVTIANHDHSVTSEQMREAFWVNSKFIKACQRCGHEFGLLNSSDNCRRCGLVVCKSLCRSRSLRAWLG